MTGAKKGRPRGAGYDKHFDAVADLILASKGTKDLSTAMQAKGGMPGKAAVKCQSDASASSASLLNGLNAVIA